MLTIQIENMKQDKPMLDATCNTNDLTQVINKSKTKDMSDDSLTNNEIKFHKYKITTLVINHYYKWQICK